LPQGSPNNPLANMLLGNATSYTESSSNPTQDLASKVISFYADDSWKATKRLSVEYGIRFDPIGR
jgi:outer membrane receptor for ferrienterochelin and colicin